MDLVVLAVFVFVYGGMFLGEIPGLALDRTGIALLGAIALVVLGKSSPDAAMDSIDVPTLALLFGLMVVSAQFRLGGFYAHVVRRVAAMDASPERLLGWIVAVAGILSALLANDIVVLAMAPALIEGCARRRLDPVPFLLALACAANVGSAATLIGNPQNMLIGETLDLSFAGYLLDAGIPAAMGLVVVWAVVVWQTRGRFQGSYEAPVIDAAPLDRWQSMKAILVLAILVLLFLAAPIRRDVLALAAAGVLLSSRRMASRDILGLVDWHLLVLFIGLFVVNGALETSGGLDVMMKSVASTAVDPRNPASLFLLTVVLSNLVSNVPAVMLLLPYGEGAGFGAILALSSTLAGNLLIVGSIANIIAVDQARRFGISIGWRQHARIGIPVTLATLAIAAPWLWWRAG
jgi:Na+/H+ antiporter NhaD/arsenite permease-like protein